jgi:hypothetical protein
MTKVIIDLEPLTDPGITSGWDDTECSIALTGLIFLGFILYPGLAPWANYRCPVGA